tara:strand:+ start:289 stop:492 length:204 start_codon:yes stop_codon:yes gene_type:complete
MSIAMNLKERGITIGDLLILIIIILTSTAIIKAFNKDNKTTFHLRNPKVIFCEKNLLPNIPFFNLPA